MTLGLYLVHCGYYDSEAGGGVFESHVDLFVVGSDFTDARERAKALPEFRARSMHVDGMLRIEIVKGHSITVEPPKGAKTRLVVYRKRGHAPLVTEK